MIAYPINKQYYNSISVIDQQIYSLKDGIYYIKCVKKNMSDINEKFDFSKIIKYFAIATSSWAVYKFKNIFTELYENRLNNKFFNSMFSFFINSKIDKNFSFVENAYKNICYLYEFILEIINNLNIIRVKQSEILMNTLYDEDGIYKYYDDQEEEKEENPEGYIYIFNSELITLSYLPLNIVFLEGEKNNEIYLKED